jgi:hypothetical protein
MLRVWHEISLARALWLARYNVGLMPGGSWQASIHNADRDHALEFSRNTTWALVRSHLFRIWTAIAVLVAYAYAWVQRPEILTWWKRATTQAIERGCDLLPYPWGDRIEATLGNFGLWVQITLAIIAFRFLMWLVAISARWAWARSSGQSHKARVGASRPQ